MFLVIVVVIAVIVVYGSDSYECFDGRMVVVVSVYGGRYSAEVIVPRKMIVMGSLSKH